MKYFAEECTYSVDQVLLACQYKFTPHDISVFLLIFSPVRELSVPKGVNCFDYCTKANVIITAGEYNVLFSLIHSLLRPVFNLRLCPEKQGIFNDNTLHGSDGDLHGTMYILDLLYVLVLFKVSISPFGCCYIQVHGVMLFWP